MTTISEWIEQLHSKDNQSAYEALKCLVAESESSSLVYPYFDQFVEMMKDANSYIRNRGLTLIAANAKWDTENKIDENIDQYLMHICDKKPITARQCIKVLPSIAKYKPDLKECILQALNHADSTIYKDSMQPLVYKNIQNALKEINEM